MTTAHAPHTSWQLANLAETASPDAHDGRGFEDSEPAEGSAGAQFLRHVEDAAYELADELEPGDDRDDRIAELADSAVPIYTHELWSTFVDLAAYSEDTDELAGDRTDMDGRAGIALYMIAERLARALLGELEPAE